MVPTSLWARTNPSETLMAAPGTPSPDPADIWWEDVRRHGAKGDGKTDDTAAIQKAIDAASAGNKVVFISPGTYRTSGLGLKIVESGVSFMGMGEYSSILVHTGEGPAITISNRRPLCLNNTISGIKIEGKGSKSHGILLDDYAIRYNIEHVRVTGFDSGAGIKAVDHNHSGHISRVQLDDNGVGISIAELGQFTDISYCMIFHNKKYGIELTDCKVINIISTQIEKNGGSDGASIIARGVDALNLIGCYNEQNDVYPAPFLVLTKGTTRAFCRAVNILGCRAIGNKKAPHAIVLESAQNVNFTGNFIKSFTAGVFALRPLAPNTLKSITGQSNALEGPLGANPFSAK